MYTHYPAERGVLYPIKDMSVPYLVDTIKFIIRTNINHKYLPTLQHHLKEKTRILFINITETNYEN